MSLATLFSNHARIEMTEAERIAFRRSLVSNVGFCGLRPVHRVLLGV